MSGKKTIGRFLNVYDIANNSRLLDAYHMHIWSWYEMHGLMGKYLPIDTQSIEDSYDELYNELMKSKIRFLEGFDFIFRLTDYSMVEALKKYGSESEETLTVVAPKIQFDTHRVIPAVGSRIEFDFVLLTIQSIEPHSYCGFPDSNFTYENKRLFEYRFQVSTTRHQKL